MDSLANGFAVVNQQPWIILIPILLDLFFLFGPRVSIAPVVSQLVTAPGFAQSFGPEVSVAVIAQAEEANLLGLLSPGSITLPTIVPALGIGRGAFMFIDSAGQAALIGLAALLVGAGLGSLYQTLIAQQARDGELSLWNLPLDTVLAWLRLVLLAVLVLVVMFLITVPFGLLTAVARLAGAGLEGLVLAIVGTLALIGQLYLFFASDAIFISRVGPIRAIRNSVAVVQMGVWATLLLAVTITATLIGMSLMWSLLTGQASWGLALGIVGNAYIASGLAAAKMLFYQERIESHLARQA
ncbi:MAG: hypothetical protein AB7P40_11940 [Chloroflexota bacterium]